MSTPVHLIDQGKRKRCAGAERGVICLGGPGAKHLAIVGSVHGDEPGGGDVVHRLAAEGKLTWSKSLVHQVSLIIGNPRALSQGTRSSDGPDLNRLFVDHEAKGQTWEHLRACYLKQVLHDVDIALDLHETSAPCPPFALLADDDEEHICLLAALGIQRAVVGADVFSHGGMLAEYVDRRGGLGLTVECGQVGTSASRNFAEKTAYQLLRLVASAGRGSLEPASVVNCYRLTSPVINGGLAFRFAPGVCNFTSVHRGQVVGHYGTRPLTLDDDAVLIACNPTSNRGEPLFYRMHRTAIITPHVSPDRWRWPEMP